MTHTVPQRRAIAAIVAFAALAFGILVPSGSASAAVNERHFVQVHTGSLIVDNSVEIWNRDSNQRVWRSDGPQLSGYKPFFTYTYTYRGGNEYLRVQVRALMGPHKDINFLNIRCDTFVDVRSNDVVFWQSGCSR